MVSKNGGCAFGKVSREKIDNLKEAFGHVESKIDGLDAKMTQLFNHNSNKLHPVAVLVITLLASLCTGLIVAGVFR